MTKEHACEEDIYGNCYTCGKIMLEENCDCYNGIVYTIAGERPCIKCRKGEVKIKSKQNPIIGI